MAIVTLNEARPNQPGLSVRASGLQTVAQARGRQSPQSRAGASRNQLLFAVASSHWSTGMSAADKAAWSLAWPTIGMATWIDGGKIRTPIQWITGLGIIALRTGTPLPTGPQEAGSEDTGTTEVEPPTATATTVTVHFRDLRSGESVAICIVPLNPITDARQRGQHVAGTRGIATWITNEGETHEVTFSPRWGRLDGIDPDVVGIQWWTFIQTATNRRITGYDGTEKP